MRNQEIAKPINAGIALRETFAFAAMAAASFVLLSLWTFNIGDLGVGFYPSGGEILNRGGALGARLADGLFLWLGVLTPSVMALLLLVYGSRIFLRRPVPGMRHRLPIAVVFLVSLATLEAMVTQSGLMGHGFDRGVLPGGVYGVHISGLLQPALGGLPSFLLVGTVAVLTLLVTMGGVPAWALWLFALTAKAGAGLRPAFVAVPSSLRAVPGRGKIPDVVEALPEGVEEMPEPETVQIEAAPIKKSALEDAPTAAIPAMETEVIEQDTEAILPVITVPKPPKQTETPAMPEPAEVGEFVLPPLSLLEPAEDVETTPESLLLERAQTIQKALSSFKVEVRVAEIQKGPAITLYELELAPGTKATKIVSLSDDLAIALKTQGIRVVYPLPGKSTVGIEVPNPTQDVVRLRELIESDANRKRKLAIPLLVGKNTHGEPFVKDLAKMPHILIAGQTGAGKSVCLNSIILSLLFTRTPKEVRLILVDPKQVELMAYENLPHLLTPVVTDMKKAPAVLSWVVNEMERRYERLAKVGVRHISTYNALGDDEVDERLPPEMKEKGLEHPMPYVVVVVDELGDLMITASRDVEESIIRLAQKSRAVGIHVVLATQRPSADVITGLIKSNLPTRIAFQVASRVDSRTILDRNGAEKLQGSGDLLFLSPGAASPIRCQGTFVSDAEIRRAVSTIRREGDPEFRQDLNDWEPEAHSDVDEPDHDELLDRAVQIILETGRGSASLLQRRLEIGYTRASRLIDIMEKKGVVGPYKGSKAREILISLEDWDEMKSRVPRE